MSSIASISTPLGKGAISIIRMSGDDSLQIAKKVFLCSNELEPRKMQLGKFKLGKTFEKCFCVYFKAPKSYTGEDMIEFQIHGGVLVTQKILETLLSNGARLAQPGEFSKIAFLNGKISLDEAESIINEINAESEKELLASLNLSDGKLKKKIYDIQQELSDILADIEVNMDYPEESVEVNTRKNINDKILNIKNDLLKILNISQSMNYLKHGVTIAIIGKTNVGKSSLMNVLIGEDVAIVTDIEGTTRDSIQCSYEYKGIRFNVIDTAGLRKSDDVVEKIGIQKARKSVEKADIVLFVYDSQKEVLYPEIKQAKNFISVINKCDKTRTIKAKPNEIEISALNNQNIDKLKEKIYGQVIKKEIDFNKIILINERHIEIIKESIKDIEEIEKAKEQSLDICSMLIKRLWNELGKITGNSENEDIINLIFSKFCLGK